MVSPLFNPLTIICIGVLTTEWCITEAKDFKATRLINGTAVCAIDKPTVVIAFDQLSLLSGDSNVCVPPAVQCALQCTRDESCTNFNYRDDPGQCELFHYTPTNCTIQPGCNHIQVDSRHISLTYVIYINYNFTKRRDHCLYTGHNCQTSKHY